MPKPGIESLPWNDKVMVGATVVLVNGTVWQELKLPP